MKLTMRIGADQAQELERLCREPDDTTGKDSVVFDREVAFPDGCRMAIQVVGETLLGEYHIPYDGKEYVVLVETEQ